MAQRKVIPPYSTRMPSSGGLGTREKTGLQPTSAQYVFIRPRQNSTFDAVSVLQPGLISQANGSAYIETEKTKIACAVCVVAFFKPVNPFIHVPGTARASPKTRRIVKQAG